MKFPESIIECIAMLEDRIKKISFEVDALMDINDDEEKFVSQIKYFIQKRRNYIEIINLIKLHFEGEGND